MITDKGEEVLRTGIINNRKAKPEEILVLEIHKKYPDVGNIQDVVVEMMLEYGTADEALDALNDGSCELVAKVLH